MCESCPGSCSRSTGGRKSLAQINGTDADDTLHGTAGEKNQISGRGGNDLIFGKELEDTLRGDEGDDELWSSDGDDTIYSGSGSDFAYAGGGNDFFGLDEGNVGDIDHFHGETGADFALGAFSGSTVHFYGGDGDDKMHPWLGADHFYGDRGSDLVDYLFATAGVTVDLLRGRGDRDAAEGDTYRLVEDVTGGAYDDILIGNGAFNVIYGQSGDDRIAGSSGGDYLDGGGGFDTLAYTRSDAAVTIDLSEGIGYGGEAHDDQFFGFEAVVGSALGDRLRGDANGNLLNGGGGNDLLRGGADLDLIAGGDGNDIISGGAGRDVLNGQGGADRFAYGSISESGIAGGTRDTISGFSRAEGDRIDLSAIDASAASTGNQAFSFIGAGAFTGVAGQLRAYSSGGNLIVAADNNGDRIADFTILVTGEANLVASNFVL